jgi:tripartite ATP-independent transporter DctM subunit
MLPIPEPGITTVLLVGLLFILFATGLPITFCLGGTATIFALLFFSPAQWYSIALSMYGATTNQILIAIPLFLLMGSVLVYTGIAEDMFDALYKWAGPLRGSLAMGTVAIGAAFGAMCGESAPATLTVGSIAYPQMLKRGYDKHLAIGSITAGGLLGTLIPPTVIGIIYCVISGISVGMLYFALFFPGFLLAGLYMSYIGVRSYLQPRLGPALSKEDRASWTEKFIALRGVILPVLIISAVIVGIYTGVVTPTEASGLGAILAFIAAFIKKGLTWKTFKASCINAFKLSVMILWLIMSITLFSNVYHASGAASMLREFALGLPVSGFIVIVLMQLSIFVFGCIMDDLVVMMVLTPIYLPIVIDLGFDPLWFGVLFLVNMNIAWLTPPYGFNLFIVKAIMPKEITMMNIYRSVIPFVACQLICLLLVMFFPPIATWLPSIIIGR